MTKVPPALQLKWAAILAKSGFKDIEDSRGNLTQPNQRTQAFETREATAEYFQLLDNYLNTAELSRLDRRILELHAEGKKREEIAFDVYRSLGYVKNCLSKHRKQLLHRK